MNDIDKQHEAAWRTLREQDVVTTADRFASELRESGLDEYQQAEAQELFEAALDELGQA